jgi:ATP-dependent Lon protease
MRGDVSSTLLELLNPEQAKEFRDNYLDIEFDFSECIFICTSNSIANMLGPLLDRIEVINVPAYLPIEKLNIGKQYLLPALEAEYGFQKEHRETEVVDSAETVLDEVKQEGLALERVSLTDAAIMEVITHYCGHEAGVRNLKKCLDRVFRKVTAKLEA